MIKWLTLSLFLIAAPLHASETQVDLGKFEAPFCMIGNGDSEQSFKKKLSTLKRYQRKIDRNRKSFQKNRARENKVTLHGSPKWVTYKYLAAKGYNKKEIEFAFLAMTLFGEARNLDENSMSMVARVINNRKKGKSYAYTVTRLAQFSTWYYHNQKDNVVLLCPRKNQTKNWQRAVKVAYEFFNKGDKYLGSTHYYSPFNMVPRFRPPTWSKGKHAVSYGGHIFLVDKKSYKGDKTIVYIPKNIQRIRAKRGQIILN